MMELDKKLKVEALLVVHPVNSREEKDELIFEVNHSVFVSEHRQVSLMAGRVKEIVDETIDKWDIFFVEKEKKEERNRLKVEKTFKVYQKDKGIGKIGSVPSIKVIDNIPPLAQGTPPLMSTSLVHIANPLDMATKGITLDDTNPES